jgi:heme exporter protein D
MKYMWIDLVFLVVVLIIAVMAAVRIRAYVLRQMAKDRREKQLREWARGNGFTYSATEALMSFHCQPFQCLQKGDYCNSFNVIEGTSGNRRLRAFDYHYYSETEPGRSKDHHYFSAVVIEAGIPLLPLAIRPRGPLDEVTEFIGFEETGFESAEFSQKFYVKAPDRRWAYDVVHQKTMELMLAHPHFLIDFQGSQIMAYYHDRMFSLGEFESALKVVTGIVDGLPSAVVEELKTMRSRQLDSGHVGSG